MVATVRLVSLLKRSNRHSISLRAKESHRTTPRDSQRYSNSTQLFTLTSQRRQEILTLLKISLWKKETIYSENRLAI